MTPDPHPSFRRSPLPALLDDAAEAMLVEFRAALADAGYTDIRPTHGCVFRFVHEEGLRLTELASLAGVTKQSAGEIVDDLTARGYVERFPDPADRRAKLIRLTEKGEVARGVGAGLFEEIEQRWAERFGAERLEAMRELLEEITAERPGAAAALMRRPAPVS